VPPAAEACARRRSRIYLTTKSLGFSLNCAPRLPPLMRAPRILVRNTSFTSGPKEPPNMLPHDPMNDTVLQPIDSQSPASDARSRIAREPAPVGAIPAPPRQATQTRKFASVEPRKSEQVSRLL
jgi:hypothetical protein